jgi:AAA ATPase domain
MRRDGSRPRAWGPRHRAQRRRLLADVARGRSAAPLRVADRHHDRSAQCRAAELEELGRGFEQALCGRRQMFFVTGEPGIGKSALVDAFGTRLAAGYEIRIAQGQCLDHHGAGEPYLPLIEALTRLAGGLDGAAVKEVLAAHAPSWLAQMPSLWTRSERRAMNARGSATRERMLRELTLAVEAITAQAPLLLILEDIHWSDVSTLDWLAHVTRRPEGTRSRIGRSRVEKCMHETARSVAAMTPRVVVRPVKLCNLPFPRHLNHGGDHGKWHLLKKIS